MVMAPSSTAADRITAIFMVSVWLLGGTYAMFPSMFASATSLIGAAVTACCVIGAVLYLRRAGDSEDNAVLAQKDFGEKYGISFSSGLLPSSCTQAKLYRPRLIAWRLSWRYFQS